MKNDRDVLLIGNQNYTVPADRAVVITPSTGVFKTASDGTGGAPAAILFSALLQGGLVGVATYTASAGLTLTQSNGTATLTPANMTVDTGTVRASVTMDGVVYNSFYASVSKIKDGLAGSPGAPGTSSPPQTAAQLKDTLFQQLDTNQFTAALTSRIGLLDSPASVAGSVAAQVKAETDTRIAAINTEVTDRGNAISTAMAAEVTARNTYVQTWAYSKQASDQSLAQFGTTITAAYKTYADAAGNKALTDAQAYTRSWGYSTADANSAIAASASTLQANINTALSTAKAYTESWGYSKGTIDAAETAQFNTLTTNYQAYGNQIAANAAADVRSYTMATSSITGAIAASSTQLTTSFTNAISALPPLAANMIPSNSLPTEKGKFTAGSSLSAGTWEGAIYNGSGPPSNGVYSPYNRGVIYTHAFGTPEAGRTIDLYLNISWEDHIPVVSGQRYEVSIALSAHRCAGRAIVAVYDANANYITEFAGNDLYAGSSSTTAPGDSFPRSLVFFTAPSNAARVMIISRMYTNGGNDPYLFASEWYMGRASTTQTVGTKYTDFSPAGIASNIAAAQAAAVVTAAADVRGYTTSSANITSAITTSSNSLTTSFQSADASNLATAKSYADSAITSYTYGKTTIDSAIATSTNSVTARLNNIGGITLEQTFTAQASAITGLSGQWVVKIDANGAMAGISLASGANGTSMFAVAADKFQLRYPGATSLIPFAVGMVAGQSVIGINGNTVIDGTLTVRAANGTVILSAGGLQPGYEAPGTKNSDLAPVGNNMIPSNSLPSNVSGFTAAASAGAPGISSWEGPIYDPNSYWSPNARGSVYTHAFGTPAPGTLIDMYWLGSNDFAKRFPVIPKQRYEFSAALSAHRCQGSIVAVFYKSNGDYITEKPSNVVTDGWNNAGSPGDNFPRALVFAVAPDDAAVVMILSRQYHIGGDNPYVFTSEMYMGRASATQTVGTKYTDFSSGGLNLLALAAQQAADAAKVVADAVKIRTDADASDSILSRGEKPQALKDWNTIEGERPILILRAQALGVSYAAYDTAKQTLSNYLVSIGPGGTGWFDASVDSPIDKNVYSPTWTAYFTAKQNLLDSISAKLAANAATAQQTAVASASTATAAGITGQMTVAQVPNFIPPNGITDVLIGGNLKSTNWNGSTGLDGAGWLLERATGNIYGNNFKGRGAVMGGDYFAYAFPRNPDNSYKLGVSGYYLGPEGLLLGSYGDNRFIWFTAGGDVHMPGFDLVSSQLTLTNTILIAPQIGANMTASLSPGQFSISRNTQQFNDVYAGTFTATAGNASSNLAYAWSCSTSSGYVSISLYGRSGNQCSASVSGKGFSGQSLDLYITCTVTDLNNGVSRPVSSTINITIP